MQCDLTYICVCILAFRYFPKPIPVPLPFTSGPHGPFARRTGCLRPPNMDIAMRMNRPTLAAALATAILLSGCQKEDEQPAAA
ncbi:MAG TPA: efflux transporter periplasmic adaptor subunit, partial [Ensifer sp.]|nr:efflux transporter periplasmic adaptor subunit [Ensifer sp.]